MLLRPANFLLVDEPTSHLDIPSRNVLEMAMEQFRGTLCFITHDRHLIDRIANKVIEVNEGNLNVYLGNYEDYLYKKEQIERQEAQQEEEGLAPGESLLQPIKKKSPYQLKEERKKEAYQRDQYRRQLQGIEKKLEGIERALEEATHELDQLTLRLSDSSLYANQKEAFETIEAHKKTQQKVKELSERWESIALELEEAKAIGY